MYEILYHIFSENKLIWTNLTRARPTDFRPLRLEIQLFEQKALFGVHFP